MTKNSPPYDDILVLLEELLDKRRSSDVVYKTHILRATQLEASKAESVWNFLVKKAYIERVSKTIRDVGKIIGLNKSSTPYVLNRCELEKMRNLIKYAPPSVPTNTREEISQEKISRAAGAFAVEAVSSTQNLEQESGAVSRSVAPPSRAKALR